MSRVFIVGSLNRDLVLSVERCPQPGQTVLTSRAVTGCGGKGANQAVSAARAGAAVRMIGCVGTDAEADSLLDALTAASVDTRGVRRSSGPSGLAVVVVADDGENAIVVAPGANNSLGQDAVREGLLDVAPGDVVLAQAEIPPAAITAAAHAAAAAGARFVLNLAPPVPLDLTGLPLDVLLVNQHEAAELWGAADEDIDAIAAGLSNRLGAAVVITLGGSGSLLATEGSVLSVPAYPPRHIVDTTGAGDAFAGVFAAAVAAGLGIEEAVRWGSAAGSLTVEAHGAQGADGTTPAAIRARIAGQS